MKIPFLASVFVVSQLLTGCAAWQCVPLPNQAQKIDVPSKARIYVILDRSSLPPALLPGSGVPNIISMNVSDDGKFIGALGRGGYLCWERPPGETIITCTGLPVTSVRLNVEPDNVYYIYQHLYSVIAGGGLAWRNELVLTNESSGLQALKHDHPPKMHSPPPTFFTPISSDETH